MIFTQGMCNAVKIAKAIFCVCTMPKTQYLVLIHENDKNKHSKIAFVNIIMST